MAFGEGIYLVTNEDNYPLDFVFDRQSITIQPGKTTMVPFEAIVEKLGDPRSGPTTQKIVIDGQDIGRIAPRSWWLKRLATYYGTYDPLNLDGTTNGNGEHVPGLREVMPKVSIKTLDNEDPHFSFPVDDPDSQFLSPNTNSAGASIEEGLRRQMAEMQRKLKAMEKLLGQEQVPESRENIPEDIPPANVQAARPTPPDIAATAKSLRPVRG